MAKGKSTIARFDDQAHELHEILCACRESKTLDFKERFSDHSSADWCELIKDFAAIANSGGGHIIIGLYNDGSPSGHDVSSFLKIDQAVFTDKLASYTGEQFSDFLIVEGEKKGSKVAVIRIGPSFVPLVFVRPGTYSIDNGKQKTAFSQGTVYFRHGAKSETGTTADLRQVIEKRVRQVRKEWFGNMRKVVTAPSGHSVYVLPPNIIEASSPTATPIRLVDDPKAPAYRRLNIDDVYPNRQVDVINFVNKRIGNRKQINPYDVRCIRRIYRVDENQTFFHKPKFGSPQYSTAFTSWLVEKFNEDSQFFRKARKTFKVLK